MTDDNDTKDDNVVHVEFGIGPRQTEVDDAVRNACKHGSVLLDTKKRAVCCRHCGAPVDPFDYILSYANGERNFRDWQSATRAERKRVDDLRKEASEVKQQIRELKRRDADAAVAAERARLTARFHRIPRQLRQIISLTKEVDRAFANGGLQPVESQEVLDERDRVSDLIARFARKALRGLGNDARQDFHKHYRALISSVERKSAKRARKAGAR